MIIPVGVDLETWAASLLIDYPADNIPYLDREDQWRVWADFVVAGTSFTKASAPGPEWFDDWRAWAFAVYRAMGT